MSELLINPYLFAVAGGSFEPEDVTGCVACWVADDCSAVGDGNAVTNWVDRVNGWTLTQSDSSKRPLYRASAIGSQPGIDFDGSNDQLDYTASGPVSTALSGHVFVVLRADATGSQAPWSSTDTAGTTKYLKGGWGPETTLVSGSDFTDFSQTSGGGDSYYSTTTPVAIDLDFLLEWSSTGTAYGLRVNNNVQTINITGGADTGDWFGDTPDRDVFVVGALQFGTNVMHHVNGKIAMVLVVDGAISGGDRTSLNSYVNTKWGITLA